jgi:O-antigen ligase
MSARQAHQLNLADPSTTFVGPLELCRVTLRMLRDHPLFGVGISGFAAGIAPYWNPQHQDRFIYPHNLLLNFWVETGILGVIAFGWLMIQAFRVTWRGWREDREWGPLHLGVLLALIGVIVHGLVDVPYWKNDLSFEFWVLLALSWAGLTRANQA